MGKAFLYGNDSDEGASQIIVTAPTGSVVKAVMGSVTKTAVEQNGTWTFRGCDLGAWTMTAAKGGQSVSGVVEIKSEGQLMRYYLTLAYFTATIEVAYPAGAVCTCSNGGTVLMAPDTSGSYTFTVHNSGQWTIKAVMGDDVDTATVSVSAEQHYTAKLSFALWLIQDGTIADEVSVDDTIIVTQNAGGVKFEGNATGDKFISAVVDLTDYATMLLSGQCQTNKTYQFLHVWEASVTGLSRSNSIAKVELAEIGANLDVSQLSGEYIVGFCVRGVREYVHTITDWYLTK